VDLAQTLGRQQRRTQGVAVAHVVVACPEAVGGQQLLQVLAQGGGLPRQVGAGDLLHRLDQVAGQVAAVLPIEGLLQHMAQQGEHPTEHRAVPQGRQPPVHPSRRGHHRGQQGGQLDRGSDGVGSGEALPLQPDQVGAQGRRIAVAVPMQPPQQGPGPIGQVALG
jgi:hypothetical protein